MTPLELREKAEFHALKAEECLVTDPGFQVSKYDTARSEAHAHLSSAFCCLLVAGDLGVPRHRDDPRGGIVRARPPRNPGQDIM